MIAETIVSMAYGVFAGVAATATMEVLASISRRIGLAAGAKGQWVGRWYLGIVRGQFVHSNIATAPEQAGEKWAALIGHYAIGIALAVLYVVGAGWMRPTRNRGLERAVRFSRREKEARVNRPGNLAPQQQ